MTAPVAGLFWTPYADWIYTVVSLSGLMLITWLVLAAAAAAKPLGRTSRASGSKHLHLGLKQHIAGSVEPCHDLRVAPFVGMVLNSKKLVSPLHLGNG